MTNRRPATETAHVCGHGPQGHRDEQAPTACGPCGTGKMVLHHRNRRCPLTGGPAVKLICPGDHKASTRNRLYTQGWVKEGESRIPVPAIGGALYVHADGTDNGGTEVVEGTFDGLRCCRKSVGYFVSRSLTVLNYRHGTGSVRCAQEDCPDGQKMRRKLRSCGMTQVSKYTYEKLSALVDDSNMENWQTQKIAYRQAISEDPDPRDRSTSSQPAPLPQRPIAEILLHPHDSVVLVPASPGGEQYAVLTKLTEAGLTSQRVTTVDPATLRIRERATYYSGPKPEVPNPEPGAIRIGTLQKTVRTTDKFGLVNGRWTPLRTPRNWAYLSPSSTSLYEWMSPYEREMSAGWSRMRCPDPLEHREHRDNWRTHPEGSRSNTCCQFHIQHLNCQGLSDEQLTTMAGEADSNAVTAG